MRFSPLSVLTTLLLALSQLTTGLDFIASSSLSTCMENSRFSASLFDIVFFPSNHSLAVQVIGFSTITGNITADVTLIAYGYNAISRSVNPCTTTLQGLCPMSSGQFTLNANVNISSAVISNVPSIAYSIPDLDGVVKVILTQVQNGQNVSMACVEASLSNGKTVYQKGVGWVTAVIAGLALFISAIASGLGHSNTATHLAANALSLFAFFQSQALFGMASVPLPPIVQSWTQNFQWSMGIIDIGFIESIATWYQRSTGGTPSTTIITLSTTSVQIMKRSLGVVAKAGSEILRRTNKTSNAETTQTIIVRGIARAGFRAGIETTNIFLTGYIFLIIFFVFVTLCVGLFKLVLEGLTRAGKLRGDSFMDFRNGWLVVLKGVLFRIILIAFPQMVVLCFWEFTVDDSPAEVALAAVTIITMIVTLGFACFKVWRLAKRSIDMHKNPAYILYSDPASLNKWGFLYVQYKATNYWFVLPMLVFILAEGLFIGLGQGSPIAQAVGLLVLNAGLLVTLSILRPFMDKKTNAFNIAIAAINFASSIFLLFFTDVFGLPGLVVGVMGVVFFIMNAAFALVLLIMVIVASCYAIFSKNPDNRYQPMRDDRGSFIKSATNLTTELDALAVTARGEDKQGYLRPRDEDEESYSSGSIERAKAALNRTSYQGSTSALYPNASPAISPQPYQDNAGKSGFYPSGPPSYPNSPYRTPHNDRAQSPQADPVRNRAQHSSSPWQRGAGYDR